ncbi:thioredoxin family protein [Candidatus Sulfurimonas marisnigri]|uniref:Thioredoxin family protein n=1 Tax=Candidatus Sulfurimonas marisnigri TaxID=2740405 RepID=A0A7S7M1D4_9BACT|nr:thioredoxin family protein [Candidatus Sulfurimonas marisnigri]QOY54454.1 thioredoxin family protein [Candidatus Sulfurimonas marisnigri]
MKLFIVISVLLSTLFSAELNWLHNYDVALSQAKEEKKCVYLFVGADVCKWCDRFKEMTLSDNRVIQRLKKDYVLLYMSRDRHKIPAKFKVRGVPRHYFLTKNGEIIYAAQGSREIDGFYDLLEEADLAK